MSVLDHESSRRKLEEGFDGFVRPAVIEDLEAIKQILEEWVRRMDTGEVIDEEVDAILGDIERGIGGRIPHYYRVAENANGEIVGLAGIQPPTREMRDWALTGAALELTHIYVSNKSQGIGTGTALVECLRQEAKASGHTEIILNSGPRYENSGWKFHNRTFGPPKGKIKDFYGTGFDGVVWGEIL